MNASRTLIVAALASVAAFGAYADEADGSQYATQFTSTKTTAQVRAELGQYKQASTSVWSTQYNPLNKFTSQRSRAEVRAEYVANRDTVDAMTGEDSGSALLAKQEVSSGFTRVAGTAVNAQ